MLLALPGDLVWNATRRMGNGQRVILSYRVRGSVRAVRAVQNPRVFHTETMVIADVRNTFYERHSARFDIVFHGL
jgi:hypothetical protein